MSAPSNGDKPAYTEYTAPTRKNVRRAPKPLRDIGVEQFVRPGVTLIGAGHVLPGSAFDMLARKKKPLQKQGGKRVKMSQYEVGEKTGNGGKTDLKGKTGVDDKTNNPAVAPGARGDTPRQGFNATDWDESLWGEHDESIDGIKPQEARQKRNNRVLKDLRPNVAIPAPAARTLKAKAGAWGASKLMKPKQDVENTVAHPTANKADPDALEAFEEKRKRQALAAKNKPTAEESYSNGHFAKRNEKAIVQVHKGKADVEYPSSLCGQPPQRKQRKRKASPTAPFFSEDEEDEDDEDDIPVVPKIRPGRAKPASRIQTHDTRNKKATSAIPAKTVVEQLSQDDEEEDDDADDDNDDDEDDDDDDEDDMPVVLNNRRRRTERASQSQAHDSQNEEAVGNQRPQDDEDEDNDDDDDDDVDDGTPIVQINRRRRAQPAQPSQPNDIPNQPTARPLSDNAAINLLMQLGAPPTQAQVLAHIPLAQFSTTIPASQPRPQPRRQPQPERQTQRQPQPERQTQRQPQPERQPQPQVQTLPKKGVAHPPQPKRARPTTATTNKKDTTPSPPSKKPRVARKTEPQKPVTKREPANPTAKEEEPAKAAEKPAAPAKKGVAAIKGKKGVAVKKPIPKKGRNKNKGYAFVTDESGSD
jgi:hypothetical protein